MESPLLVSACLVGFRCRYDGGYKTYGAVMSLLKKHTWLPICPEQRAGLPTPRVPMAFAGGTGRAVLKGDARIVQLNGQEVTEPLLKASRSLVELVRVWGIKVGILKERSPSCGVKRAYVGDKLVGGMGVFTAMLIMEGVEVFSEETIITRDNKP